jgi:hypothetical protein
LPDLELNSREVDMDIVLFVYVTTRASVLHLLTRWKRDDRGEGVISTAIAVLIVAFLGALMWVGFREIWLDAEENTRENVGEIGE